MVKITTEQPVENIELFVNNVQALQSTQSGTCQTASISSNFGRFNLGLHVGDDESTVLANRHYLQRFLPKGCEVQWLEQVHGNDVLNIENVIFPYPSADAIITRTPNIALAIMTADCLPILLSNKNGDEVAALHCGWRSIVSNIIGATLNKMICKPEEVIAWLGPCISQQYFEVGEDVRQAFIKLHPQLTLFFAKNKVAKYQANLSGIAKYLLELSGVTIVIDSQQCTYANQDKYYSYRRNNITGRMASVICIKS
ncbi:peptidoglycan editing factor PgeF [Thalassotalea profundi]|uniref:Purine nucleoside phosphorylase n=1 Tax=Thalassotalea profundi TaxID=2036687 RepID=A0ABQ3IIP4_9GAMM|nr:peptidoglycan editing factor PgeF [Thalassotalea profundi]GHE79735.1 laccase domain protein [Thalassotalea profundi]